MFILKFFVFTLLLVFSEGDGFYSELSSKLQRINNPEGFGLYLENQLARNESRFLSKQCVHHLKEYIKGLLTFRLWAIQMFDANAKFPSGLLRGNLGSIGQFDQCLNIQTTNKQSGIIRGKYCLGSININFIPNKQSKIDVLDEFTLPHDSSRLIDIVNLSVGLPWGVCLPDSCSAKDFQFLHTLLFLSFNEEECQTKATTKKFDNGDIGALVFMGIIAALIVGSTLYEAVRYYIGKDKGLLLIRSFSILTNGSKILKKDENQVTSCLHGMRSLNLLVLIVGYRYIFHLFVPLNNLVDVAKWIFNNAIAFEAVAILDTYFVISGTLVSYNYLKAKERGIKFNIILYYLKRIIRFTIPLAVIILINATLIRHIGNGPLWSRLTNYMFVENCRNNWWTSLAYIQNYAHPHFTDMCVFQAWHLSVDMQLFILTPLFLIPLIKHPKYVLSASLCLIFGAMVANFLIIWVHKMKSVILTIRSLCDVGNYIEYIFLSTYTRISPWIIGLILGYIIFKSDKIKLPFRKSILAIFSIILWAISLTIIVMGVKIADDFKGVEYNWLPHAFHRALLHPLWSLAISWIIFACTQGYSGPVNSILSAHIFQFISKISYGTFLTNFTLISVLTFQTRTSFEFSNYQAIYKACADLLLCLGLGFVWTISFESPFVTIAKVIFKKFERGTYMEEGKEQERKFRE